MGMGAHGTLERSRVGTVAAGSFWLLWRAGVKSTSAVKMKIQALSFFRDGGHVGWDEIPASGTRKQSWDFIPAYVESGKQL
ncbi:hypothetical protein GCM10007898_34040 [Dyella flagellata]|uniref:Uncharacterized protein n=1 Tax=Dyella flagellata TaxID=1867833 RepID=A0ABQ5XF62_9GAMM|nr:hypothetical protein GCM10007898_34040 [Dyella flagellata]